MDNDALLRSDRRGGHYWRDGDDEHGTKNTKNPIRQFRGR